MSRKKKNRYGDPRRNSPTGRRGFGLSQKSPIAQAPERGASEFKQVSVVIVEEHLGLPVSDLAKLRAMCAKLPFEASMSLVANLAGRVETVMSDAHKQLQLAAQLFRVDHLIERYAQLIRDEPRFSIFGPQSLYALMRVLVEEARDAPLDTPITAQEHAQLLRAIIASNSVIETGRDLSSPPGLKEYLAYEFQVGAYYSHSRPGWKRSCDRRRCYDWLRRRESAQSPVFARFQSGSRKAVLTLRNSGRSRLGSDQ